MFVVGKLALLLNLVLNADDTDIWNECDAVVKPQVGGGLLPWLMLNCTTRFYLHVYDCRGGARKLQNVGVLGNIFFDNLPGKSANLHPF